MGLILDSSVLIAAERKGLNARQALSAISQTTSNTEIGLSVVTLLELVHGAARADGAERRRFVVGSSTNLLLRYRFIR